MKLVKLLRQRLRRSGRSRSLEQTAPGGHVDVHLRVPGQILALSLENLLLPLQTRLPRNHRIQELDLKQEYEFVSTSLKQDYNVWEVLKRVEQCKN